MKLYDIVVATPGKEGSTFWRTIGTVFAKDDTTLEGDNDKPAGFTIDFPSARGIIVPRKKTKDGDNEVKT